MDPSRNLALSAGREKWQSPMEADLNGFKHVRAVEQIQEMIQKREVAVDLLSDGAVRRKLLAELDELRKPNLQSTKLAQG